MKRFDHDYEDEDDFQDDNLFSDTDDDNEIIMSPEQYAEMVARQEALSLMQLELVQIDLNQRLLFQAVDLVKKSTWFFSFRSQLTQLRKIAVTYQFLKNLVSQAEEK